METIPFPKSNTLKREISQMYNQINQEIFGLGVKKQRIEVIEETIIIFGQHKRVPALSVLEESHQELTLAVDATLISEFKRKFKGKIEQLLNQRVVTILKDYDPQTERACTVIYLEKN